MSAPQRPPARPAEPGEDAPAPRHPPAFNVPPATLWTSLLLVAVFALTWLLPAQNLLWLVYDFGFVPMRLALALQGHVPPAPALWPLVTHMLLHVDWLHLALNVGFLVAFGSPVERRMGVPGFLAAFVACGVVGALFMMIPVFTPIAESGPSIGASGGVFGLMGVALAAGLNDPRFRLSGARIILVLFALNLVIGLLSEVGLTGEYRIAWMAHTGGFLTGLLIGLGLRRRESRSE